MKLRHLIPSHKAADDQIHVKLMCVLKNFAAPPLFTALFFFDVFFFFVLPLCLSSVASAIFSIPGYSFSQS